MRAALLVLALLTASAAAQSLPEGTITLVAVDAFERPGGDRVWTDMRPLTFKGSDEELQAATGATLYAGPAPGTLSIEAWHERFAAGAVDCSNAATVCAARVQGEGTREALIFPFGASSRYYEVPMLLRMRAVPQLTLSDAQSIVLGESDMRAQVMLIGEANLGLRSLSERTVLVTSRPAAPDCGDPTVHCGVVFEVEVTAMERGLAVVLL